MAIIAMEELLCAQPMGEILNIVSAQQLCKGVLGAGVMTAKHDGQKVQIMVAQHDMYLLIHGTQLAQYLK